MTYTPREEAYMIGQNAEKFILMLCKQERFINVDEGRDRDTTEAMA